MMKSDICITQVATGYTSDPISILFPLCCVSSFMLIVCLPGIYLKVHCTESGYSLPRVCQVTRWALYAFSA